MLEEHTVSEETLIPDAHTEPAPHAEPEAQPNDIPHLETPTVLETTTKAPITEPSPDGPVDAEPVTNDLEMDAHARQVEEQLPLADEPATPEIVSPLAEIKLPEEAITETHAGGPELISSSQPVNEPSKEAPMAEVQDQQLRAAITAILDDESNFTEQLGQAGPNELVLLMEELARREMERTHIRKVGLVKKQFDELFAAQLSALNTQLETETDEAKVSEAKAHKEQYLVWSQRLSKALITFNKRRTDFEQGQQAGREKSLEQKRALLEELKQIVHNEDVAALGKVRNIQNKWRSLGQVPQADMEDIMQTYRAYLNQFYNLRERYNELIEQDRKVNLEEKEKIVSQIEALLLRPLQLPQPKQPALHGQQTVVDEAPDAFEQHSIDLTDFDPHVAHPALDEAETEEPDQPEIENPETEQQEVETPETAEPEIDSPETAQPEIPDPEAEEPDITSPEAVSLEAVQAETEALADALPEEVVTEAAEGTLTETDGPTAEPQIKGGMAPQRSPRQWQEASDKVKALHEAWKQTGPVPREQTEVLWQRFKAATDQFYAERREFFEVRDEQRLLNTNHKQDLLQKVAAYTQFEGTTKEAWMKATLEMQVLQDEWNRTGPATLESSKPLFKQFKDAQNVFYKRRGVFFDGINAGRGELIPKKEALLAEAEQLGAQENWLDNVERFKELQREWKATGGDDYKEARKLHKRFRKVCDTFFNRLKEHLASQNKVQEENLEKKTALLDQMDALLAVSNPTGARGPANPEVSQLLEDYFALGHVPIRHKDRMTARLRKVQAQLPDTRGGYNSNYGGGYGGRQNTNERTTNDRPQENQGSNQTNQGRGQDSNRRHDNRGGENRGGENRNNEGRRNDNRGGGDRGERRGGRNEGRERDNRYSDDNQRSGNFVTYDAKPQEPENKDERRLVVRIRELDGLIEQYENNISFIAKGKSGDQLRLEINANIAKAAEEKKKLAQELKELKKKPQAPVATPPADTDQPAD